VHPVDDPLALGGDPGAGLGDRDDPGSPIGAGGPALGQAGPLQGVHRDHHGGLVQVGQLGDLDLGPLRLQGVQQNALCPGVRPISASAAVSMVFQHVAGVVEQAGEILDGADRLLVRHIGRIATSIRNGTIY